MKKKLIKIALNARVDHPRVKGYYTGFDGIGRMLPGTGGICYNVFLGENCMNLAGDHIEPGVTMAHASPSENMALMSLSCVGNDVEILSGPSAGRHGYVSGKHGGVNHVMAYFPQNVIEKMTGKEDFLIRSYGQGMEPEEGIVWMNLDPDLKERMVRWNEGKAEIDCAFILPSYLIGAGLGTGTLLNGDIDLMIQDEKEKERLHLQELRFGDLVAIEDLYCEFGPYYLKGALSIGIITHSDSFSAGHGPGLTIIATDRNGSLRALQRDKANLIDYMPEDC